MPRTGPGPLARGAGVPAGSRARRRRDGGPLDEREAEAHKEKAAGLLTELGPVAAPAAPALALALESRSTTTSVRSGATAALGEIGPAAGAALPVLRRAAHREPVPGFRDRMLDAIVASILGPGAAIGSFGSRSSSAPWPSRTSASARAAPGPRPPPTARRRSSSRSPETRGLPPRHAVPRPGLRAPDVATCRQAATALGLVAGSLRWRGRIDRETAASLRAAFRSGSKG